MNAPELDTKAIRATLEERLSMLDRRVQEIGSHLRNADGRNEADFADRASFTEADEVLEGLDDAGRKEMAALRAALHRLDDGSYGTCQTCGDDIAARRLEALPTATQCIHCAST